MHTDVRLRAAALVPLLVAQLLTGGFAQASPRTDESRARIEVQRARRAFEASRFQEALDAYSNAYSLDPRPPTLFNIAQCHRRLQNHERAAFFYRRYLASYLPGHAPSGPQVERLIAEMEDAEEARLLAQREAQSAEQARLERAIRERQERALVEASASTTSAPSNALAPSVSGNASQPRTGWDGQAQAVSTLAAGNEGRSSIFRKWWFWTGVGVVAAAAGTTAYVLSSPDARQTTLGTESLR